MRTRCTSIFIGLLGGLHLAIGAASAQESLLQLPLEKLTISEALAKSKREHRVLIVVREWKRPPQGRRPWWANDSVRAWIMWHAVMVEISRDDPEASAYFRGVPIDKSAQFWGIDVFVDGIRMRMTKIDDLIPVFAPAAKGPDDWEPGEGWVLPTATSVLFQFDLQLQAGKERSVIWREGHERDCPEPQRPGRMYYFGKEADGLPTVGDLRDAAKGDLYPDVLARLQEADRAAGAGDKRGAFALLTWAWERGPEVDPGFALVRLGLVLPRMAALASTDSQLEKRMSQIADAELALYPWYDDSDEVAYLALRYHEPKRQTLMQRVIVEGADLDEETMGGIVGRRLCNMKVDITECSKDKVVGEQEWRQLVRDSTIRLPRATDPAARSRWDRQHVELLAVGTIRSYATLIASDSAVDRARADQIAQTVLAETAKADPPVRAAVLRALVFAAASVGRAGPVQAEWLKQAEAQIQPSAPVDLKADVKVAPAVPLVDPLSRHIGVGGK